MVRSVGTSRSTKLHFIRLGFGWVTQWLTSEETQWKDYFCWWASYSFSQGFSFFFYKMIGGWGLDGFVVKKADFSIY